MSSATGAVQKTFTVAAGKSGEVRMQASDFGTRYVNITSKNGYPLKGSLAVRVATTSSGLG
ncbi:hypothetical protein [Clostridium formicaceticum]|uniref:Uncharacterized protein n=1 Tax=Clostridium formicaceticum TaxID=1497 RepID=A0ABM6ENU0_9CLOT|nr:hypothetical protein [Clostridium formicaceticum]AOY74549.1 hypothetical protein BJL90_00415 [Clostridium formicaceticum]